MTAHQLIKLGASEALGWQQVADALVPIGQRRVTLAEVVQAAETLVAARRLLKGTGWARVVERRGHKSLEVSRWRRRR